MQSIIQAIRSWPLQLVLVLIHHHRSLGSVATLGFIDPSACLGRHEGSMQETLKLEKLEGAGICGSPYQLKLPGSLQIRSCSGIWPETSFDLDLRVLEQDAVMPPSDCRPIVQDMWSRHSPNSCLQVLYKPKRSTVHQSWGNGLGLTV